MTEPLRSSPTPAPVCSTTTSRWNPSPSPRGVSQIDAYALICCNTLKEVIIPEGVTLLDEFVLADCTALEHITLPASLTEIRETALMGTYDTVTYHVAEGSYAEQWCRDNGITFEYTATPAV